MNPRSLDTRGLSAHDLDGLDLDLGDYASAPDSSTGAETTASCGACDAVCCRLTVVVMPDDPVPRHLVDRQQGLDVMARDEDGWCVAVDRNRMCCSIYELRPAICRKFAMGSPYCLAERETYRHRYDREIPLHLE